MAEQSDPAPTAPTKSPVDLSHPDIAAMTRGNSIWYVLEFHNDATGTGPHVGIAAATKGADIVALLKGMLLSRPQIVIDWAKGLKGHPNMILAHADAEDRKKRLYIANPDRVGAEEMYADGVANRILEDGKPE